MILEEGKFQQNNTKNQSVPNLVDLTNNSLNIIENAHLLKQQKPNPTQFDVLTNTTPQYEFVSEFKCILL